LISPHTLAAMIRAGFSSDSLDAMPLPSIVSWLLIMDVAEGGAR